MRMSGFKRVITSNRLRGFDAPTVWNEFSPLSVKHGSCNMGQGFPDWESAPFIKEAMTKAVSANFNQYCRSEGDLKLVETLANYYGKQIGRVIDPKTEVTVSVGATEGLFAIMQSFLNEGDEVVVLEPAFDIYPAQIQMSGGVSKMVPLRLNEATKKWYLDMNELEAAITPKTKLMILNTPHNPTGKVFTREELGEIREMLLRHDHVTAVMDEVYEHLVYDKKQHVRFSSLPDMWNRTLTVSSCGKTFSTTGWKVGWVYGPQHLVKPVMQANQWVQFCVSSPTQRAVADVLEQSELPYEGFSNFYSYIRSTYEKKRNHMIESLEAASLSSITPEGGFFIMADTAAFTDNQIQPSYWNDPGPNGESPVTRDWAFARWLTVEHGVTPIPPSAFYTPTTRHLASNLARFAICKRDETLEEARKRLHVMAGKIKASEPSPVGVANMSFKEDMK